MKRTNFCSSPTSIPTQTLKKQKKENIEEKIDKIEKIISFVKTLDDDLIRKHYNEIIGKTCNTNTNTNTNTKTKICDITSCGLTSLSILKIFAEKQGEEFPTLNGDIDIDDLLDENIVRININGCKCCEINNFVGHAFLIACINNKCLIIQSYIGEYDHRKYFDIIQKDIMKENILKLRDMCVDRKMDAEGLKILSDITHIDLQYLSNCQLEGCRLSALHIKNKFI